MDPIVLQLLQKALMRNLVEGLGKVQDFSVHGFITLDSTCDVMDGKMSWLSVDLLVLKPCWESVSIPCCSRYFMM